MDRDIIKEEIKYYTETVKVFWTIFIVLTGGLATILINPTNVSKIALFVVGAFFEVLIINVIKDFNKQIQCLLKKMEDLK